MCVSPVLQIILNPPLPTVESLIEGIGDGKDAKGGSKDAKGGAKGGKGAAAEQEAVVVEKVSSVFIPPIEAAVQVCTQTQTNTDRHIERYTTHVSLRCTSEHTDTKAQEARVPGK